MLVHREPEPGEAEIRVYVPEEETTSPKNLFGIGLFAAFGFLVMAGMSEPATRPAPLFVGALILGLLAIAGAWLAWQKRFGQATLKAKAPFTHGARFEGWIETELTGVPSQPVRVIVEGQAGKWTTLHVRQDVAPAEMRTTAAGKVLIPFSLPIPDDEDSRRRADLRVMVRTDTWPLGWGATFLLT